MQTTKKIEKLNLSDMTDIYRYLRKNFILNRPKTLNLPNKCKHT